MKAIKETPWMGLLTPLFSTGVLLLMGIGLLIWGVNVRGLAVPPLIIAAILIYYIFYYYRDTTDSYRLMYQIYPELSGRLGLLLMEASYLDEDLRVLIYKDLLVSYKDGLRVYLLKDIHWIYQHNLGGRAVADKSLMIGVFYRQRYFLRQLPVMNLVDATDAHIAQLFDFIEQRYPHIMLGYTPINNQFFGLLRAENDGKPKRFWDFLF